ncbi:uncharacterized protein Dyak_GE27334 [Drosophila yakuba]|uniref:Uncharacterized protein n=1 Tax=Drosophila yakuba TaxID=7245 RepID=A0A0R1E533_DROYA|nr:uncharacterized protein Dyak_GE27334 [Drosophila yakuba]
MVCSTACNNSAIMPCKIDGFVGCWDVVGIKWLLYGRPRSRTSMEHRTLDLLWPGRSKFNTGNQSCGSSIN